MAAIEIIIGASNLQEFSPGDWVEVSLGEGESRQTVKNRLKRAAEEFGYTLQFERSRGVIRFQVVGPDV